jgi:hypothetical protein
VSLLSRQCWILNISRPVTGITLLIIFYCDVLQSGDSSVGIQMGYKQGDWSSIPGRIICFHFYVMSIPTVVPARTAFPFSGVILSPGVKQPGLPSSAEVNNAETIPPLPHASRGIVLN